MVQENFGNRLSGGSRVFLIALLGCLLVAGCGYHLAQRGDKLPAGIKTIAVPVMRNDTTEAGLEAIVSDELRRRIAESGWADLAPVEEADATLVGVITKFKASPISFSTSDYAVEYRISMRVSVRLVTRKGITLWEDHNLVKMREYRQVTDIFDSEANKEQAIRWLASEISADIHDRIFDGFY